MDVPRCTNEGMCVQIMDSDHFPVLLFLFIYFFNIAYVVVNEELTVG